MQHIVGADAHIGPFRSCEFAKILCGTGLPCRALQRKRFPSVTSNFTRFGGKSKVFFILHKTAGVYGWVCIVFHINEYL